MHNKKIIAKGLIVSILLINAPMDSMANVIEDYKLTVINERESKFKEFFNDLFDKFKQPKETIEVNKNIRASSVYELTLNDGEFVPNLDGNPQGYETIKVTTIGSKKLTKEDYDNIRASGIPNVDLSSSNSDAIYDGVFEDAIHLTSFKFPKGIKSINKSAFEGCINLSGELNIPDTVTKIGIGAFWNCSSLTGSLIIPNSVVTIGGSAFDGCTGFSGDLVLPNSIERIEYSAFASCNGFKGDLILPKNIKVIDSYAFWNCSGFQGNVVIPDSLEYMGEGSFEGCTGIREISIKINEENSTTNYKKEIVDNLPDNKQTILDISYNVEIKGTWIESTNKTIGRPIVKNIVDGQEQDLIDGIGQKVSLYIPVAYEEEDIIVIKDEKPYNLPTLNDEQKYIFNNSGLYEITLTTSLGNVSNITFEVENKSFKDAENLVLLAEQSKSLEDIKNARELVNSLPESINKDLLQERLNQILPNIEFETKTATANLDVYIKSENLLSLSLNTNSVTFEDFSGIEDDEKLNALTLTVNSSLPYKVNAYLPNEIIGSKFKEQMNKEIFNIRANGESDYQTFKDTENSIILLDDQVEGNNKTHGIDLMLKGNLAHKKDIYKATIKLEVEQK